MLRTITNPTMMPRAEPIDQLTRTRKKVAMASSASVAPSTSGPLDDLAGRREVQGLDDTQTRRQ